MNPLLCSEVVVQDCTGWILYSVFITVLAVVLAIPRRKDNEHEKA